jgi:hypothetical protein
MVEMFFEIVSTKLFDLYVHHATFRYDAISLILNHDESVRLKEEREAWKTFQQRISITYVSNSTGFA